jgi:diguanylate cyclase (GGDEF)-like protein
LIVGLLVVVPSRLRPWVIVTLLPGEFITDAMQGYGALTALGWATNNVLEAALAAWILLTVAGRRPRGNTVRDFVAVAVAAVSAPLVGGLGGSAVSVATFGGPFVPAWLDWWRGDATGIMLVVPLVVSLAWPGPRRTPLLRLVGLVEVGLVIGAAVSVFAFTKQPLEFLILPPMMLLAVRRDLRLTALAGLSFAIVATVFTGHGLGPLSNFQDVRSRVLGLQTFITTTAFVAFLICAMMSERKGAETALTKLATHDPLTGLANRRRFMERLAETAARHDRSSESAAVAYFDLDGFKQINDDLGHAAGDAVLVEVGRRLAAAVRDSDLVARLGGDEFAALLEPVDGIDGARLSARRMADAVEQPFTFGDRRIPIGVSVGFALAGSDSEASLAEADTRLYRDKNDRHPKPVAASAA